MELFDQHIRLNAIHFESISYLTILLDNVVSNYPQYLI